MYLIYCAAQIVKSGERRQAGMENIRMAEKKRCTLLVSPLLCDGEFQY
jgi:hypothetical protein